MKKLATIFAFTLILFACADAASTPSYEEMKKLFIDALHTEDGKKALREIMNDPSFRELLVLEHSEVQNSISNTLLSEDAEKFWKKKFEDPKFKEDFAKGMEKELKELQKQLMNDAGYQEQLTKFFDQPEMQKQLESILKGTTMRKEIEKVVQETIENPLMQSKWQELIRKSGEADSGESKKGEDSKQKDDKKE